jgi:hypothetical protein
MTLAKPNLANVDDTENACFSDVADTGNACIAGVVDTGKTVYTFS